MVTPIKKGDPAPFTGSLIPDSTLRKLGYEHDFLKIMIEKRDQYAECISCEEHNNGVTYGYIMAVFLGMFLGYEIAHH